MVGQHPRWGLGRFLAASVTTIEAIKCEPQREVTRAIAAPTLTHHSTSYPGGGTSKVIMALAIPFFRPARLAKNHENPANEQKNGGYARDLDSCITVLLFRTWHLRASSAHPRHLSCATKRTRGWRRRARGSANLLSCLRASLFVGWALCDAARLFRISFRLTTSTLFC